MSQQTPTDDLLASAQQRLRTEDTAIEISEAKTERPDPNLDPVEIEKRMIATVLLSPVFEAYPGPCETEAAALVRALLLLQGSKGRKLVFTRFDIMQIFSIWTRKLEGKDRI